MEETIVKYITIGVAILLAAGLIGFVVSRSTSAKNTAQTAADEAEAEIAAMIGSDIKSLSGSTVTGQQVLQYIAKAQNKTSYFIVVTNAAGGTTSYIYNGCSESTTTLPSISELMSNEEYNTAVANAKDASQSSTYINPTGRFHIASASEGDSGVVYDANGTLIGIVFKQIS